MRSATLTGLMLAFAALPCHSYGSGTPPRQDFVVTYHPTAKRPYKPDEPPWRGAPPCSQYPESGSGPLSLSKRVSPPKLVRKEKADYGHLTEATRPFTRFLAEFVVSTEGRVTAVRVLRSVSDEFDALVLGELESSVYEPARLNGRAVAVCVVIVAVPHP